MNNLGYQMIFCFENILRSYIVEKTEASFDVINKSYIEEAKENMERCGLSIQPENLLFHDILSFLHLGQLLDLISSKNFRKLYENGIWKLEKARFSVISTRNEIMHSRIIFESEVDDLKEDIELLIDALKDRKYTIIFNKSIEQNFNNYDTCIPFVSYPLGKDFTKLVGRSNDLRKVMEKLEFTIPITIAGMGGLGKSALVLQLIEDIVSSPNPQFKKIVFMSFKDSYYDGGIRDLTKAISDYNDLIIKLSHLFEIYPGEENSKIEDAVLDKIFKEPTLLILDNLETEIINSDHQKFINLARAFSRNFTSNSRLLITSRSGLGQIEDKYDLTTLNWEDTLELLSLIADKKIKVTQSQMEWIEKYCEGNPLQIKTLAIVLKEANVEIANLIIQYESRHGSLARKVLTQKEAFLNFCFDNTICTLSKEDQILFTIVCEICSRIDILLLNYEFFNFMIDHLELTKYNINSFEPNNFIRLTLLYFDSNADSKNFKLNVSAMQYLTHGRELANHYNKHDLIKNIELSSMIDSTVDLIKEIMHHSTKVPTINIILEGLYNRKYLSTGQDVYLHYAFNINPSMQSLVKYLDNTEDILGKINLIDLLLPRELNEMTSVNIRNQNIVISKFLFAILKNKELHLFILKAKLDQLRHFPFLNIRKDLLSPQNKKTLCKVLLKIKNPYEALEYLEVTSEDDDIKFEVYSKIAEEARKTNKPQDVEKYFKKCEQLLEKGAFIRDYESSRYLLYYGKYLYEKDSEKGIRILSKIDLFEITNVSLLSFTLESLIIRAEHYKSQRDTMNLNQIIEKLKRITVNRFYLKLYYDKRMMFENRLSKLSS